VLISREELLYLIDAYNDGKYSFAEVLLASGMNKRQFIAFLKENHIELKMNFDFIDKGRGLNEDILKGILEMDKNGN
jgi:hypothetical protein